MHLVVKFCPVAHIVARSLFKHGPPRAQVKHSNWCVMNLTTAANYFHALRAQVPRGPAPRDARLSAPPPYFIQGKIEATRSDVQTCPYATSGKAEEKSSIASLRFLASAGLVRDHYGGTRRKLRAGAHPGRASLTGEQVHRDFRKPLIIASPKLLLRPAGLPGGRSSASRKRGQKCFRALL